MLLPLRTIYHRAVVIRQLVNNDGVREARGVKMKGDQNLKGCIYLLRERH